MKQQLLISAVALAGFCAVAHFSVLAQQPAATLTKPVTPSAASPKVHLEKSIPELMRKASVPGLQIALIKNGKTEWLGDFGVRNATSRQPVTNDTIFEAASLSKTVFAYGVLQLVDHGKLDLDAPLTRYLPKPYIEGDDRLKMITARIVLSHRTGFPNWRGDGNALTIRFTPGERFSYSGEGFVYLQKVVEQITGKPLNEYMNEAVFAPLGMKSSSYIWRSDFDARAATGHDAAGQARERYQPTEANAAASLQTTASDYAMFVEAILNGAGLRPETLRQMETPQIAVDPSCTNCTDHGPKQLSKTVFWGLGWGIARTDQGEAFWHWGDNGAFKCFVAAFQKSKTGVVFFANSENGLSIAQDIVQQATGSDFPAFAWLKYDRYDSPSTLFAAMAREKGASVAVAEFANDLKAGTITEDSLNSMGYSLLGQKKTDDALLIFQLNVKLHPDSWNVYDSLGEAYMGRGDKPLAISNYEKSLELNPKNSGAAEAIKKLKAN